MSDGVMVVRLDGNWIDARLPTVSKAFRQEMLLLHAVQEEHPDTKGYRDTFWRVPAFNAGRLLEAVEDMYQGWYVLGSCDSCKTISDDVTFRYPPGWRERKVSEYPPDLCTACYTEMIIHGTGGI